MIKFLKLSFVLLSLLVACEQTTEEPTVKEPLAPSIEAFDAAPRSVTAGEEVRFSWRAKAAGGALECLLDVDNDGEADYRLGGCAEGVQTHRYAQPGSYSAKLTLTEGGEVNSRLIEGLEVTEAQDGDDGDDDNGEGDGEDGEVHGGARITLFNGKSTSQWRLKRGGAVNWPVVNGALQVKPGYKVGVNDIRTKETFRDFRLHLEFRVPSTPSGTPEQDRGNSGVYLQGRYEVQVLDSHRRPLRGKDDAGALYGIRNASKNASRPSGTWQSYDIVFRAARWSDGRKVRDARVSVRWNGTLVHDNVRVTRRTRLGSAEGPSAGPILLQDHGDRVRYRNIWIEPLE